MGVFILGYNQVALAAFSPSSNYLPNSTCPEPPSRDFAAICGQVLSSVPMKVTITSTLEGAQEVWKPHAPVEGVSVYIYDCDNMSASCKRHGNLVNLFASTSTDEDGKFYLLMRKLDNFQEVSADLKIPRNVQSKKRYLVFNCGDRFAGMQVIPSYIDQTDLIQEVQCGKLINAYVKPKDTYVLAEKARYANEMGTDIIGAATDPNGIYPESYPSGYINHLTSQVAFKQTADYNLTAKNGLKPIWDTSPTVSTNFDLQVIGADPRFNKNATEADWINRSNLLPGTEIECPAGSGGSIECQEYVNNPELGSFWERDCFWKYRTLALDTAITNYCLRKNLSDDPAGGVYVNETKSYDRQTRIDNYYYALRGETEPTNSYNNANFVIQNKLPDIPPQEDVMFYKDLPARQDVTECVQDPTDIAKFLGLQFSNCIGAVNLRREGEVRRTEEKFMSCERLRMCGRALGTNDSSPTSWINFFTVNGPAQAMANPTSFVQKYDSITIDPGALNVYVCKMNPNDPNEIPVKISDIQPPWITDPLPGQYKLDSSYWSSELMYYFGKNNTTAKYGLDFYGNNDSYYKALGTTNTNYFRTSVEAGGVPQQGGTFCTYQSGGKKPNNTMAGALDIATNSATGQAINALANVLTSPVKEFDASYAYELRSGIPILSAGRDFNTLGEYSRVNSLPEKIIIGSTASGVVDDYTVLSNVNFKGDEDHYPYADFSLSAIKCAILSILGNPFHLGEVTDQTVIEYAIAMGCTYDYTAKVEQQIICGGDKYSISSFKTSQMALNIAQGTSLCQFVNSWGDGTRTPTSSIYVTSAANRRLKGMMTSSYKPSDFFDSLLSIDIGEGILDFQLSLNQFILGLTNWIQTFLGTNQINKSFMDRINAVNTLEPNPGEPKDDLHAKFSVLSEANFVDAFPLPLAPDEGGQVLKTDWGPDNACYPWNTVDFNDICNTDQTEAKITHTDAQGFCTGSADYCQNLLSRTCRVDDCRSDAFVLPCTCTRTPYWDGPFNDGSFIYYRLEYSYSTSPICPSRDSVGYDTLGFNVTGAACINWDRYYCAEQQRSCMDPSNDPHSNPERQCIRTPRNVKNTDDALNRLYNLLAAGNFECDQSMFGPEQHRTFYGYPPPDLPPTETASVEIPVIFIPACNFSKAGPYTCSGDLTKDSELKIQSTIIDPLERAVIPASTSADALLETNNELLKAWANPYQAEYSFRPYQSLTALTSVTNSTPDSLEIYRRKDTYGIGGAATLGARLRTMFGSPTRAATDPSPEYKDFNIHCTNPSLGSIGSWSCNIENPPDPEVINLQLLDPGTDPQCNFNPSDACALLILGRAPDGSINQFSESFVKVMDNIGGAFGLPPSVIMSYMSALKMNTYAYYFSNDPIAEKEFINVTAPWYGEFESCDNTNTASQGPYDWITYWFNNALRPGTNGFNLLNNIQLITGDVATGRGKTANKCNFLDGSYAVASSIASDGRVQSITECQLYKWEDMQTALTTLFVGGKPVGAYKEYAGKVFSPGGLPAQIFTACRNL